MSNAPWYAVANVSDVPSPALLVYPDRVERNIDRMIARAGDVRRLRPHVKTHKTTEVTKLMLAKGITQVKTATLVEAEMCAAAGMPEVLLSFPQVGPNVARLLKLSQTFPQTKIATLSDDEKHVRHLSPRRGGRSRSGSTSTSASIARASSRASGPSRSTS